MNEAPKLFPDRLDDLLAARLDASGALVRARNRDDERRLYSFINRLSDRIDRLVAFDMGESA